RFHVGDAANVEHGKGAHRREILARDVARPDDAHAQALPCGHDVLQNVLGRRPAGRAARPLARHLYPWPLNWYEAVRQLPEILSLWSVPAGGALLRRIALCRRML